MRFATPQPTSGIMAALLYAEETTSLFRCQPDKCTGYMYMLGSDSAHFGRDTWAPGVQRQHYTSGQEVRPEADIAQALTLRVQGGL